MKEPETKYDNNSIYAFISVGISLAYLISCFLHLHSLLSTLLFPSATVATSDTRPLQQPPAGSCMHLKHICCAKDDWRLMHEVEREIKAGHFGKFR